MMEAIGFIVIVGMVGLFFATFWIKNDDFWKHVHRGFIWIIVIMGIIGGVWFCAENMGRGGDSYDEPTYRGRR